MIGGWKYHSRVWMYEFDYFYNVPKWIKLIYLLCVYYEWWTSEMWPTMLFWPHGGTRVVCYSAQKKSVKFSTLERNSGRGIHKLSFKKSKFDNFFMTLIQFLKSLCLIFPGFQIFHFISWLVSGSRSLSCTSNLFKYIHLNTCLKQLCKKLPFFLHQRIWSRIQISLFFFSSCSKRANVLNNVYVREGFWELEAN